MNSVTIYELTSVKEAVDSAQAIVETFKEESVVALRGINPSYEEQIEITRALGDVAGWVPNNSTNFLEKYVESHERLKDKESISGDDIALGWHMEHVEFDDRIPIVAGSWNMVRFTAPSHVGKTLFVDTSKIYNNLAEEEQEFLGSCVAGWRINGDTDVTSKVVKNHWLTGEKTIRIAVETGHTYPENLFTVEDRTPSETERKKFVTIRDKIVNEIRLNKDIRISHSWQQGDLLIPDLFKGAHAATGGFSSDEREFIGMWLYPTDPAGTES